MFNANKTKKIVAVSACVLTMGGMMLSANAAEQGFGGGTDAQTKVVYDNRQVVPGPGGADEAEYGIVIPSGITFTNESKTADASLTLIAINGSSLSLWKKLEVTASVQSANGFQLADEQAGVNNDSPTYQLTMNDNQVINTVNGKGLVEIEKKFDVTDGTATVAKIKGEAKLIKEAAVKGSYTDTLTYTFKQSADSEKM